MRTGDDGKHLQATLEWAARRDTAAYGQRFGAQATRHLRAARVHKSIQRGRFAASVARDLTGGLLRQVRGGGAVVVAMGTARVRGGDAWLRRHLRRLCWFVDQDEFNTSKACSECHDKMVLIYSTGNSPPKIPGELYGPPAGPLPSTRRVRMAAGSRRGRPKRALPSATHVTRRGPDPDAYRAAVRATARAAAVARRAAALAACAVEDRAVYADPRRLSVWAAKGCYTCSLAAPQGRGHPAPHPPVIRNRDDVAARNMAWVAARRLTGTNVWPFKRPFGMRWAWTAKRPPSGVPVPPVRRTRATTRVDVWPVLAAVDTVVDGGGGGGGGGGRGAVDGDATAASCTTGRGAPGGERVAAAGSSMDGVRRAEAGATDAPRGLVDTARR
ncbi:hypothetical protein I4F81_012695 [Pyropia yezoensis]|uniref:Uncharacterized protein n=1 Tax=Pyropia yezoensis TaxID=2788 RepID=A0ACC3CJE2_PYRYE|nr:hypothetical protein I4F81_012695 [Neopyropia yezoensis]